MLTALIAAALVGQDKSQGKAVEPDLLAGIGIEKVSVWNDVTLRNRFVRLSGQLGAVLGLDPASIQAGLYTVRGGSADNRASGFSIMSLPLPSLENSLTRTITDNSGSTDVTDKESNTSGTTTADGKTTKTDSITSSLDTVTKGSSSTDQRVFVDKETRPVVNPTAPNLALDRAKLAGDLSIDSLSRVGEYTNLFYEITNLQMVAERAASHVVDLDGNGSKVPRVPVVLGFPISLNPGPKHHDALAEVLVTVAIEGGGDVYVTSIMPQERSYNVARVVSDQKTASLGAVFSLLNIGFATGSSKEKAYLSKDYDTVALHPQPQGAANPSCSFGWQFRPTFGSKRVSPGRRMLFAGLSLPSLASGSAAHKLKINVKTSWRHRTSDKRAVQTFKDSDKEFEQTISINSAVVKPTISSARYSEAADGLVDVEMTGSSFLEGMDLLVGNRLVPPSTYLNHATSSLRFRMTRKELAFDDVNAVSMFGTAEKLQVSAPKDLAKWISRAFVYVREGQEGFSRVQIVIGGQQRDQFLKSRPVVVAGGQLYGLSKPINIFEPLLLGITILDLPSVPTSILLSDPNVSLTVPFLADEQNATIRAEYELRDHGLGFDVTTVEPTGTRPLVNGGTGLVFTLRGRGLNDVKWKVPDDVLTTYPTRKGDKLYWGEREIQESELDKLLKVGKNQLQQLNDRYEDPDERLRRLIVPKSYLDMTDVVVLEKSVVDPIFTDVRDFRKVVKLRSKKEPEEVLIDDLEPLSLGSGISVKVTGQALARVTAVRWNGKPLRLFLQPKTSRTPATWYLELPDEFMGKEGKKTINFVIDDHSERVVNADVKKA